MGEWVMNQAHVISMNDAVRHVFVGDKQDAEAKLVELRQAYFDAQPHGWNSPGAGSDFNAYCNRCYWHIRTVPMTEGAAPWIEWEGGECPVPWYAIVEVKLVNGNVTEGAADELFGWDHNSESSKAYPDCCIVAYRVLYASGYE